MPSDQPMMADLQGREKLNFSTASTSHDTTSTSVSNTQPRTGDSDTPNHKSIFPILSLPLELRLKIYAYILPPRHHKIATSLPPTNYFYNTSSIPNQSTYPFGRSGPPGNPSVTYKVLTKNTHASYPHPSITVGLLLSCKQIHAEAELVLYSSNASIWDFGVHLEALRGFWGERSEVARQSVRNLRIGFEVPVSGGLESGSRGEMLGMKAVAWLRMVEFVVEEMRGLRSLDLMLWCADGSESAFPEKTESSACDDSSTVSAYLSEREIKEALERSRRIEIERRWTEWKWTADLLFMPSLRQTKISCWAALLPNMDDEVAFGATAPKFDSWVAGRMVADGFMREKMIKDGVVVGEEVVVLGPRTV